MARRSLGLGGLSCSPKLNSQAGVTSPQGFEQYREGLTANGKKNLLFLHVHHCPNCDMVRNHLINTPSFQKLTEKYNRYTLELGQPLGRVLMEKYDIRGGPVFVLTDENFKILSKSPYGFLDQASFSDWLHSERAHLLEGESKILSGLLTLFPGEKGRKYEGLFQYF